MVLNQRFISRAASRFARPSTAGRNFGQLAQLRCFATYSAATDSTASNRATSSGLLGPADFTSSNVFAQGVPFFATKGMALIRISPATFKKTPDGRFLSTTIGSLRVTFYPRSETEENKFDTQRALRISIRGVDVGSLLEIDAQKLENPTTVNGGYGTIEIAPKAADEQTGEAAGLTLKGAVTNPTGETPSSVEVDITTGQFRTLQTILTHATPSLFGWQVLLDPSLVTKYMDADSLREFYEEKESKATAAATETFFQS